MIIKGLGASQCLAHGKTVQDLFSTETWGTDKHSEEPEQQFLFKLSSTHSQESYTAEEGSRRELKKKKYGILPTQTRGDFMTIFLF